MKKQISLYIPVLMIFVLTHALNADNNTTVDTIYSNVSDKVLTWSDYLDKHISRWLSDDNTTTQSCVSTNVIQTTPLNADSFFQNNRYLNDTRDIYVRMRLDSSLYTRQSNKLRGRLSAQLPFNRCKKQWKLYIEDPTRQKDEILPTDTSNGGIGIRYSRREKYGIDSSYSLGLTHGSPYLRARYKFPLIYKDWKIEPIQTFKYSHKYYFEEESNIYFDKYLTNYQLFRIQLHRKTATRLEGMDYGVTFQYYINLGKNSGLEFTQSFFGNTHYNDVYSFDKEYSGINNYVTSVSWRENIWRKWLYYEIKPSINFHKDNDYEATYSLRFLVDIYFGLYH